MGMRKAVGQLSILVALCAGAVQLLPGVSGGGTVDWRIVGVEQLEGAVVVLDGAPGSTSAVLRAYHPGRDSRLKSPRYSRCFTSIDDCKVRDGGRTALLCDNHCFGEMDLETGALRWCAVPERYSNLHSIERLPDGRFVAIASVNTQPNHDGNRIILVNPAPHPFEPERQELKTVYRICGGHGLQWDARRNCLWVLGYTNLVKLAYHPAEGLFRELAHYDYTGVTGHPHGHDLCSDGAGGLFITCNAAVAHFDPEKALFAVVYRLKDAKSFSPSPVRGDLMALARTLYYTDRATIVRDGVRREIGPFPGKRFYKFRWFTAEPEP